MNSIIFFSNVRRSLLVHYLWDPSRSLKKWHFFRVNNNGKLMYLTAMWFIIQRLARHYCEKRRYNSVIQHSIVWSDNRNIGDYIIVSWCFCLVKTYRWRYWGFYAAFKEVTEYGSYISSSFRMDGQSMTGLNEYKHINQMTENSAHYKLTIIHCALDMFSWHIKN